MHMRYGVIGYTDSQIDDFLEEFERVFKWIQNKFVEQFRQVMSEFAPSLVRVLKLEKEDLEILVVAPKHSAGSGLNFCLKILNP